MLLKYNGDLDRENDAKRCKEAIIAGMQRLPQRPAEHFLKDMLSRGL
jgi:hypothetical protein